MGSKRKAYSIEDSINKFQSETSAKGKTLKIHAATEQKKTAAAGRKQLKLLKQRESSSAARSSDDATIAEWAAQDTLELKEILSLTDREHKLKHPVQQENCPRCRWERFGKKWTREHLCCRDCYCHYYYDILCIFLFIILH